MSKSISKFNVILSTPNNRGIHRYSNSLFNIPKINYECKPKTFKLYNKIFLKNLRFVSQVLLELFINFSKREKNLIFTYPRLPLNLLLRKRNKSNSIGIVVYDFIQCISFEDFLSIFLILKSNGLVDFLKKVIHTTLFNKPLTKADYFIVISDDTKKKLLNWMYKNNLINSGKIIVLHPLPSFNKLVIKSFVDYSNNIKEKISTKSNQLNIIYISGNSPSKRKEILIPIFEKLASNNSDKKINVSIFGAYLNLEINKFSKNLKIRNFQNNVEDKFLIETYINSHIYISTFSEEGFGIPFLYAILFGCSCVCADIQVYKEIKKKYCKYNQNVFLVNDKDKIVNSFYKSLEYQFNNLDKINPKKRLQNYINNYKSIVDENISYIKEIPII
tara:strand:+ start:856 stop:2019 length:1164 start_codon:yes stop_codon:yes gene_type:complete